MRFFINVAILMLLLSACSDSKEVQVLQGHAQGTTYHIHFYPEDPSLDIEVLNHKVIRELENIDAAMSGYRQDSTIERFNNARNSAWHNVGTEIVELINIASEISNASGGCYDLTIKPLFALWGFNDDQLTVPEAQKIKEVENSIGMEKLNILLPDQLRKRVPTVEIDLSSIAQGYSAARLADILEQSGIVDYMVEIGGEVVVAGQKPGGQPWRIAIERPLPGERRVEKVISIHGSSPLAVVTSGTYRHYFDEHGARYSHILDARTRSPVKHNTVSVTVVHDNATYADAWSTALLCLGTEEGVILANLLHIPALFIQQDNYSLRETQSDSLRHHKGVTIE